MDYLKSSLTKLTTQSLFDVVKDAESRIGSHFAGGNPVNEYIEKQRGIILLVQEELDKRRK